MLKDHLKKLGSDSVVYGLGGIVNRLLSFLLVPLFTRYLQPQDYGIMSMIALLNVALAGLFTLGTGNSMGIYYFQTEERSLRDRIVWTTWLLLLVNIATLLCICIAISPYLSQLLLKSRDYSGYIVLALSGFALQSLAMPFTSYLRMERKPWLFCSVTLFSSVLTISLNIVAVVFLGRGVRGMLETTVISGAATLLLLLFLALRRVRFGIDLSFLPKLVKTGFPSIFGVGAFFMVDYVDRAFIQRFCGLEELGVYSLGYTFGMIMILFAEGSFGSAWAPYFSSFINKREEASQIFGSIFKYAVFGYGMLALLFFVAARPLVSVMAAPKFEAAWTVVGMVAAAYMMKVLYLILLPPLYFERKLHLQTSIEWVAAIVNLGLNFLLIPVMMKEGAALATLVAYVTLPLFTWMAGKRLMHIDYEWKKILTFSTGFVVVAVITFIDFGIPLWYKAAVNLFVFCLYSWFLYSCLLTAGERGMVLAVLNKIGLRRAEACRGES